LAPADILIADDFHPLLFQRLDAAGIAYSYQPNATTNEIMQHLRNGVRGLVVRSKISLTKEVLQQATGLRLIARGGAGMDNVDELFATEKGIVCINAGEANSDAVGEHTIGMLLSLFHKIAKADAEVRNKIWDREGNRGLELAGKNIAIIGFGNTGSAVARKLAGFNMGIMAYDKFKKGFGNASVTEVTLDEIFETADIVTIHVPLDRHTKHMVNSEFIQSFVRKIFLLNLSRGAVVKTENVITGLQNGKIRGFAADVLENENPQQMGDTDGLWFRELVSRNDVVLTPHVAGWTVESYEKISEVLAEKICREWPLL
jgi:D-3-phosphoglycerate dehydrogenase